MRIQATTDSLAPHYFSRSLSVPLSQTKRFMVVNPDHRPPVHGRELRRCKGPRAEGSTSMRSSHDDTTAKGRKQFVLSRQIMSVFLKQFLEKEM